MKKMQIKLVLLVVFLAAFIFVGVTTVSAAEIWRYNCTILKVGVNATGVQLKVDQGGTEYQKYLDDSSAARLNRMLATVLSAEAQTKTVHVLQDTTANEFIGVVLSNE